MSKQNFVPFKYRVGALMASKPLQPFWRAMNAASFWGLGYNNWHSAVNGEDRFIARWAAARKTGRAVIVDVGANEGDTTQQFLDAMADAQCHLFEPNPKTFARLSRRYGGRTNVRLNQKGVGDKAGHITLHDFDGPGSERASFLPETFTDLVHNKSAVLKSVEVEVVTLDDYARSEGIAHIDFLKIDAEGFERFVLEGAQALLAARRIGVIQLEMNEHNVISNFNIYGLKKLLAGYDIYRILPSGLEPVATRGRTYLPAQDVPRYCNLAAILP